MKCSSVCTVFVISLPLFTLGCGGNDDQPDSKNPFLDSSEIDQSITDFLATNPVAGLSVATMRKTADDTLIWSNQYGLRERESNTPVDSDTSFWLGSLSKAVMGTTLMIANEKGFLQLDEDVHGVLSNQGSFSLDNPKQHPITIGQLATHTSGILDNNEAYACAYFVPNASGGHDKLVNLVDYGISCPDASPVTLAGFLAAYLDAEGEFYSEGSNFDSEAPGTRFNYSNIAAGLAGHLVELFTGQDLATYAQQEIFSPLAMSNTSWRSNQLDANNIAMPYVEIDGVLVGLPVYELATWPDGGLRSNAADIAKLLSVVVNKGQQLATDARLLSEASIETMLPGADSDYGIFWAQEEILTINGEQRPLIGHTGSDPGAFSFMFFDAISETGVVLIGNGDDNEIDESAFIDLLEELFESAGNLE